MRGIKMKRINTSLGLRTVKEAPTTKRLATEQDELLGFEHASGHLFDDFG
jgi:hypothetical protein